MSCACHRLQLHDAEQFPLKARSIRDRDRHKYDKEVDMAYIKAAFIAMSLNYNKKAYSREMEERLQLVIIFFKLSFFGNLFVITIIIITTITI